MIFIFTFQSLNSTVSRSWKNGQSLSRKLTLKERFCHFVNFESVIPCVHCGLGIKSDGCHPWICLYCLEDECGVIGELYHRICYDG